jgi:hypothetical protein
LITSEKKRLENEKNIIYKKLAKAAFEKNPVILTSKETKILLLNVSEDDVVLRGPKGHSIYLKNLRKQKKIEESLEHLLKGKISYIAVTLGDDLFSAIHYPKRYLSNKDIASIDFLLFTENDDFYIFKLEVEGISQLLESFDNLEEL